jgi:PAS domain S-box-containing protein
MIMPQKSKLLLVDDRPENLLALEAVLKSEGYQLLSAASGQEALNLLKDHSEVDVILLDIQMPQMDGYELAKRIKQMEGFRMTPIIFITAIFTESPHIKKGYEAGAIDYFTKPFDPDILRTKIAIYASFRQRDALLKEREARLKESEELLIAGRKLSEVLKTLPVGVVIANNDGGIFQINDEVLRILESTKPEETDSYGEFLDWWTQDGQVIKESFSGALRSGQSIHNKIIKIRCFDKTVKTILSSVSPLRGLDNQIVGACAVIQDITQHKKMGEDMEKRILKLISLGVEVEQTSRR